MATSVERILHYNKDEDDYYKILGCDETSTIEQINAEYKIRALQYHPDKNQGNDEALKQIQKLNEAKEILCDPLQRKNYDKWRHSGISISYKKWTNMKDHVHQSMHWAKLNTKDRMLTEDSSLQGVSGGKNSDNSEFMSDIKWEKQSSNEIVNKFRNYKI